MAAQLPAAPRHYPRARVGRASSARSLGRSQVPHRKTRFGGVIGRCDPEDQNVVPNDVLTLVLVDRSPARSSKTSRKQDAAGEATRFPDGACACGPALSVAGADLRSVSRRGQCKDTGTAARGEPIVGESGGIVRQPPLAAFLVQEDRESVHETPVDLKERNAGRATLAYSGTESTGRTAFPKPTLCIPFRIGGAGMTPPRPPAPREFAGCSCCAG